jgi:hypothetical protein
MKILILMLTSSFLSFPALGADRTLECKTERGIIKVSFELKEDGAGVFKTFDADLGTQSALGKFQANDLTDFFVTHGTIEIRARKANAFPKSYLVISLRGDYELQKATGTAIYVEESQDFAKSKNEVLDVSCE